MAPISEKGPWLWEQEATWIWEKEIIEKDYIDLQTVNVCIASSRISTMQKLNDFECSAVLAHLGVFLLLASKGCIPTIEEGSQHKKGRTNLSYEFSTTTAALRQSTGVAYVWNLRLSCSQ